MDGSVLPCDDCSLFPFALKMIRPTRVFGHGRSIRKGQYSPSFLNDALVKTTSIIPPSKDLFKSLNLNPLSQYKNTALLSHFVTQLAHIKPRIDTGLSKSNQKKVARAIKRAKAMGLMPYTFNQFNQ